MNNRKKGRRAELECKELLESEGWIVELIDMPKKYKKSQDFFGMFDIIAVKSHYYKFIQVKCNIKPKLEEYQLWSHFHACDHISVEVWIRKDNMPIGERWRIIKVRRNPLRC